MTKRNRNRRPDALSSRHETLRALSRSARGEGFTRYPEGVFTLIPGWGWRQMVTVFASVVAS
jgi:hypothetical protein